MRAKLVQTLEKIAKKDKKIVFLTGDLGFHVLEPLKKILGKRFINAGASEQNMATVAAGLAYLGFQPWIYSITPFVSIKILEQIRNDICYPKADVKIISIGGGFDYEVAGPTHHGVEDVGLLLSLPNIKVYAPAFAGDVETIVYEMYKNSGPAYLRLTKDRGQKTEGVKYSYCRNIIKGKTLTIIVLGSIVDQVIKSVFVLNKKEAIADVWSVTKLPLELPENLIYSIKKTKRVCIVEEHIVNGGLGQNIACQLNLNNIRIDKFTHLFIKELTSKKTGSRDYYLKMNRLDWESIIKKIQSSNIKSNPKS